MEPFEIFSCIISSISASLSASIVTIYLTNPSIRRSEFANYVLILILLDLLLSITYAFPMSTIGEGDFCRIEAFLNQFFISFEIIWTGIIALAMYKEVYLENGRNTFPFKRSFIISFIISVIPAIIAVAFNWYQPYLGECLLFLKDSGGVALRFISFYGPLWIINMWDSYVYIKISKRLESQNKSSELTISLKLFILGPLIFYTPITGVRILQALDAQNLEWVIIISSGAIRCIGIFNAVVYGLNKKVRYLISRNIKKALASDDYEDRINASSDRI